jgi:hypothetical protein
MPPELDHLKRLCIRHNWRYHLSSDKKVYSDGAEEWKEIALLWNSLVVRGYQKEADKIVSMRGMC